jgi:hypothetical protein
MEYLVPTLQKMSATKVNEQLLAKGEWKKILLIMFTCLGFSHITRKHARQRWLGKDENANNLKLVDHPFIPYLLENGAIVSLTLIARRIGVVNKDRPLASFFTFVAQSIVSVNGALLFQKLCADYLYEHVPFFTNTKPSPKLKDILADYLRCNFINDIVLAVLQVLLIRNIQTSSTESFRKQPLKVIPFLGKLMFARLVVDVAFYVVHRGLHTKFGYNYIHYRHHEHTGPRIQTNYHFLPLDLFMGKLDPTDR